MIGAGGGGRGRGVSAMEEEEEEEEQLQLPASRSRRRRRRQLWLKWCRVKAGVALCRCGSDTEPLLGSNKETKQGCEAGSGRSGQV